MILTGVHDGDQGPIYEFTIKDGGVVRDSSSVAVEFHIDDRNGNHVCTRPGVLVSPKSGGKVRLYLKGKETDWGGAGARLIVKPRLYYATAPDRTPAVNLLVNPSFDAATGSNPSRIADSWVLQGARTAVWDNYAQDSAPPVIFGTFQLVNHSSLGDPDYIQQSPAVSLAVGDQLSVGCWHRMGQAAEAENDNHGIFYRPGSEANRIVRFRTVESDWYFVRGTTVVAVAAALAVMGIDGRGTTGGNRYDEAFMFKGFWRVRSAPAMELPVHPRSRPPKTTNQLAGVGSFEADSNGDGLADGVVKFGSSVAYSMETDPANVHVGRKSQKCVLTDPTNNVILMRKRGKWESGKTYRASAMVKTQGALTPGAGTGGFLLAFRTDYFDDYVLQSASTNLGTNLAAFTQHSADLTLSGDRNVLTVRLYLNGYTGTIWIDDVQLKEV